MKKPNLIPPGVYEAKQNLYGIEVNAQIIIKNNNLTLRMIKPILLNTKSKYELNENNILLDKDVIERVKKEQKIDLRAATYNKGIINVMVRKWLDFKIQLTKIK